SMIIPVAATLDIYTLSLHDALPISRASSGRDVEGLADDRPEIIAVLNQEVVLRARTCDPDVVSLLECVVADEVRGHLPGEGDDRNRVHHRVLQRRHQIGRGRTGGHEADADLARGPRVAFRCVAGGGFLADEDVAQALEIVQSVVDGEYRAAGQTEHDVDSLALEALQNDSGPGHFHFAFLLEFGPTHDSPRCRRLGAP